MSTGRTFRRPQCRYLSYGGGGGGGGGGDGGDGGDGGGGGDGGDGDDGDGEPAAAAGNVDPAAASVVLPRVVTLEIFSTFYKWWIGVLNIIRGLRGLWCDSNPLRIEGFLSRAATELTLGHFDVGTFLIRFSESKTSYLAIAWVNRALPAAGRSEEIGKRFGHCLVECRHSGFVVMFPNGAVIYKTLSELIHNLKKLVYLYPKLHKDQAFLRDRFEDQLM